MMCCRCGWGGLKENLYQYLKSLCIFSRFLALGRWVRRCSTLWASATVFIWASRWRCCRCCSPRQPGIISCRFPWVWALHIYQGTPPSVFIKLNTSDYSEGGDNAVFGFIQAWRKKKHEHWKVWFNEAYKHTDKAELMFFFLCPSSSLCLISLSPSFLTLQLYRTFREMSKTEEQLSLCRELCEDLAEDLKKEGLKVLKDGCFIYFHHELPLCIS